MRIQEAADLELPIGANYRVRIDGKIHRQLAHRGELVTTCEPSGSRFRKHLVHDLAIDGNSRPQVELDAKWRIRLSCFSHFDY